MNFSQLSKVQMMVMLTAVIALSACGGGGGGSDDATTQPPPAPAPATPAPPAPAPSTPAPATPTPATPAPPVSDSVPASALQGRWLPSSTAPGYTLIVLPAASNSAQAWALAQDGSALAKLSISSSATLAITGSAYSLNSTTQTVSPLRGTATAVLSNNTKTLSLTGLSPNQLDFTQGDALTSLALQSDLSANWRASFNQGSQVVNWTIASSGALSGNSNTGCTWTGSLLALSNASVYSASLTESCSTGDTQLEGIATLNPGKTQLSVVTTSNDQSKATALQMLKVNP